MGNLQSPIGYQVRAILSGFTALYALFIIGCLVLFGLVLEFMSGGWLKDVFLLLVLLGFFTIIIYACILERKRPEAFAMKQEIKIIVEQRQIKIPEEEKPRVVMSKPGPPLLGSQPNNVEKLKQ